VDQPDTARNSDPDLVGAFANLASGTEETIDLARASLAAATIVDPALDPNPALKRLDDLAAAVRLRVGSGEQLGAEAIARSSVELLFEDEGFTGDEDDYYNPLNACLDAVLERRRGLPILLSILFIEVAGRAGLTVQGVGAPAHFVVKYADGDRDRFLDPFNGGVELPSAGLRGQVEQSLAGSGVSPDAFLEGVTKRQILARVLANLKGCYLRRRDPAGALRAVDYQLAMTPWALDEVRDRGLILYQLKRYDESLEALHSYREHADGSGSAGRIDQVIRRLERLIGEVPPEAADLA
jgi:regulator of sirC expression with transglutaminase-like and TPR domain